MKAEFYVSNMGRSFVDLDNSFSDVVVGCTSFLKHNFKNKISFNSRRRRFHKAQMDSLKGNGLETKKGWLSATVSVGFTRTQNSDCAV